MGNVSQLFHGDHTHKIKKCTPSSKLSGIMQFTTKTPTCIGCRVKMDHGKGLHATCEYCVKDEASLYMQQMDQVRNFEQTYSQTWAQCQRCSNTLHQFILCSNSDCPIFYRRKKVQKDLVDAQTQLDRFTF
jgi:DNA polymerase delta subunit 1